LGVLPNYLHYIAIIGLRALSFKRPLKSVHVDVCGCVCVCVCVRDFEVKYLINHKR